jgi:GDP-D-mannose dehydratase
MKKALISGITRQVAAYLRKFLLNNRYEVHCIKHRSFFVNIPRFDIINEALHFPYIQVHLFYIDLSNYRNLISIVQQVQADGTISKLNFTIKIKKLFWNTYINFNERIRKTILELKDKS